MLNDFFFQLEGMSIFCLESSARIRQRIWTLVSVRQSLLGAKRNVRASRGHIGNMPQALAWVIQMEKFGGQIC